MEIISDEIFTSSTHVDRIPGIAYRAYLTRCGWCNRIHYKQHWITLSVKEQDKFQGRFSHAICPQCLEGKFYVKNGKKTTDVL